VLPHQRSPPCLLDRLLLCLLPTLAASLGFPSPAVFGSFFPANVGPLLPSSYCSRRSPHRLERSWFPPQSQASFDPPVGLLGLSTPFELSPVSINTEIAISNSETAFFPSNLSYHTRRHNTPRGGEAPFLFFVPRRPPFLDFLSSFIAKTKSIEFFPCHLFRPSRQLPTTLAPYSFVPKPLTLRRPQP